MFFDLRITTIEDLVLLMLMLKLLLQPLQFDLCGKIAKKSLKIDRFQVQMHGSFLMKSIDNN